MTPFPKVGPPIGPPAAMHLVGPGILLQGLLALALGLYFGGKSLYLRIEGRLTTGTVVGIDGNRHSGSPVVEFTARSGKKVRVDGISSSRPPKYAIGDKVKVHYLDSDPELAVIDSFVEMWILPTATIPVGAAIGAIGLGMWKAGLRRKRWRERAQAGGLRLDAVVVGSNVVQRKSSVRYEPIVEAQTPSGQVVRCTGDQVPAQPMPGARAVVLVDPEPPHGTVVVFGG